MNNSCPPFGQSTQLLTTGSPPRQKSAIVEKSLDLYLRNKYIWDAIKYGSIHAVFFSILMYDISRKCPYYFSNWYYVEYAASVVTGLSLIYYIGQLLYYKISFRPVEGTVEQRKLLRFQEDDGSFIVTPTKGKTPTSSKTPPNITALSWHSSFNDSNRTIGTPGWNYARGSPQNVSGMNQSYGQNISWNGIIGLNQSNNSASNSAFVSPYKDQLTSDEFITEQNGLDKYLKTARKELDISQESASNNVGNVMNSFWGYCNNAANLLKTSAYQLSPSTSTPNKQTAKDDVGMFNTSGLDSNSEMIKKISTAKLSEYVANLRMWISSTILERLVSEINKIDNAFKSRGFSEIQIGSVGLERLKKTTENQQLVSHIPVLPMIIPFLEMSANQEYLVQRIRDLSRNSCIGGYRWNSGTSYHGLNWDEHLPTDAAIIFHIFCAYLDSQLMPLPQPGGRPFFNRYVVFGDKKTSDETLAEVNNKSKCAILCSNSLKPKFSFISDNKIHNCVDDRNSLFYVIIQFLIYMKTHHDGLLEGVNLGKSGINIMCVIED